MTNNRNRKWIIECTEDKLRLMANSVEDVMRFISGQPQLMYSLMFFDNGRDVGDYLRQHVTPMLNPDLGTADCYGWDGRGCKISPHLRSYVAKSYATYKSILTALANEYDWHNVHSGRPLTCEEGGSLMTVRPAINEPEVKELWTATNPDGKQCIYLSKPVRRKWANCEGWEPSEGGSWYCSEFSAEIIKALALPQLTWEDEPYRFQLVTEG